MFGNYGEPFSLVAAAARAKAKAKAKARARRRRKRKKAAKKKAALAAKKTRILPAMDPRWTLSEKPQGICPFGNSPLHACPGREIRLPPTLSTNGNRTQSGKPRMHHQRIEKMGGQAGLVPILFRQRKPDDGHT